LSISLTTSSFFLKISFYDSVVSLLGDKTYLATYAAYF
jgi:hypothetical protein